MLRASHVVALTAFACLLVAIAFGAVSCTTEPETGSSLPLPATERVTPFAPIQAGRSMGADVDVVIWGTQTSGLAALRELTLHAPQLKVAVLSSGDLVETPLAQGLSVEDARNIECVSGGFYAEWRQTVIEAYALREIRPFNSGGRFVYEPEVAAQALWSLIGAGSAPAVSFYAGRLVAAHDEPGSRFVDIRTDGGGTVHLTTRYFIDASVEADLARLLGADYRVGSHEAVYNDRRGSTPPYPSAANNYETAPQRFSALLTLKLYYDQAAPPLSTFAGAGYNPASYGSTSALAKKNVSAFRNSWTMKIAVLPEGKRELNEAWNDWPDVGLSFQWLFSPEKRDDIKRRVIDWAINRVRYLQEHGYPELGISSVPETLYVREGPRVVGLDTYTGDDLRSGRLRDPVAVGCYVEYDRHDSFSLNHIETTRYASVPMGALLAQGHPYLLVCTAVSADYVAYSSAVRMEHARANMGGAAAAVIITSERLGTDPDKVPYEEVRSELLGDGYIVEVPR